MKGIFSTTQPRRFETARLPQGRSRCRRKSNFGSLVVELRKEPQAVRSGAADFAECLAYSGLRLGEAREVRWCDVNFADGYAARHRWRARDKEPRASDNSVVSCFEASAGARARRTCCGGSKRRARFRFQDTRQALGSACRRAGLPRFGHHALRHFFCSNAIEAGIDFKAIAGWLGHKDGGVLAAKTYGHLRNEHSAAMAQRMTFDALSGGVERR